LRPGFAEAWINLQHTLQLEAHPAKAHGKVHDGVRPQPK
jgi:hypothetical protein